MVSGTQVDSKVGSGLLQAQSTRQGFFFLVGVGFLAKAIGFARETATAHAFGVSREFDIFLTIFMIPTVSFSVLTYAVSYSLIPFYHKVQVNRGEWFASQYMKKLICGSVVAGVMVAVSMLLFENRLVSLVVVSATPSEHAFAVRLLRTLVWLMPLYFGVCILQTLLQAEKYFLALSIGPLVQNIVITLVILLFGRWGVVNLAVGWLFGILVWFIWLTSIFLLTRKNLDRQATGPGVAVDTALLGLAAASVIQVVLVELWPQLYVVFDRIVAQLNHLPSGSIGALNYAGIIYALGLSLFVISLGQAMFPSLSSHAAAGREEELNSMLSKGFRATVLATLPMAALLIVLAKDVVVLLFQRGQFNAQAAVTTADALRIFALGLPLDSVYVILIGYLYAKRNFKILIQAGLLAFFAKVLGGMLLVMGFGYIGLALSTVLATFCRTGLLVFWLSRGGVRLLGRQGNLPLVLLASVAALLGMVLVQGTAPWVRQGVRLVIEGGVLSGTARVLVSSLLFITIYSRLLGMFKIPEWVAFRSYLKARVSGGAGR